MSHSRERELSIAAKVRMRNMQRGDKWFLEQLVIHHVEMASSLVCNCHTDQLRLCIVQADTQDPQNSFTLPLTTTNAPSLNILDSPPAEPSNESDSPVVEPHPDLDTHSTEHLPCRILNLQPNNNLHQHWFPFNSILFGYFVTHEDIIT